MNISLLPFQTEIATRMIVGTDEHIDNSAQFYQTTNHYWIAWQSNGMAAVLAPNTPESEPCDWVEGAESLEELITLIENGDYANMMTFDGSDEEWAKYHGCQCGHDEHHHH